MWWAQSDDLVDELIANNAARPIPGMEKPDLSKFVLHRLAPQHSGPKKKRQRARKRPVHLAAAPDQLLVRERLRMNVIQAPEA